MTTNRHFKCISVSISGPGATVNPNGVLIAPQKPPQSRRHHCLAAAEGRAGGLEHELPYDEHELPHAERWIVMLGAYHAMR